MKIQTQPPTLREVVADMLEPDLRNLYLNGEKADVLLQVQTVRLLRRLDRPEKGRVGIGVVVGS